MTTKRHRNPIKKSYHIQEGPGTPSMMVPVYCGGYHAYTDTVSRHGNLCGMQLCPECEDLWGERTK